MLVDFVPIEEDKVDDLRDIALRTFIHSYKHLNTPENFKWYVDQAFTNEKLLAEIRNKESFYFFVVYETKFIGYLKLNIGQSQSEQFPKEYMEIERIYLEHAFQRKGIGRKMINFAIQQAQVEGKTKIWLGVWERNPLAVQFYQRMGFEIVGDHIFVFGDENQIDLIMEINVPKD
ncbi:MAG: GNAT family N-acetyltransferase [Bacteroidota bacterium]